MTVQAIHWIAGSIVAMVWGSRFVETAFGVPRITDITRPEWDRNPPTLKGEPRVSIIVPARNEEAHIRETLSRLLALEYSNYEIIAVNDRSTDRTGEIMDEVAASSGPCGADTLAREGDPRETRQAASLQRPTETSARLRVVHVHELPPGWLGKTHAMWTATRQATGDWLLFTDADVLFQRDALRRAIAYGEAEPADHIVVYPRMLMQLPGERMMMGFLQTFLAFGHRPWKVADPGARDYIGVGAFNLVRRKVYEAVGTYQALRMEVLDDLKLGKVVKNGGFAQRGVFGDDLISLRWAHGATGIIENLTKNFFALLSFQWWRTVGSVIAVAFLNLGPFLGVWLAHGWARLPYAVALFSIFLIYRSMSPRSTVRPHYFLLHPLATGFFMYLLLRSMFHALWNDGVIWRGTRYPLEELRKGLV